MRARPYTRSVREWRSLHFALLRDALRYVSRNHRWHQPACFWKRRDDVNVTSHFHVYPRAWRSKLLHTGLVIVVILLKIEISKAIVFSAASVINIGKPLSYRIAHRGWGRIVAYRPTVLYSNMLIYHAFALLFHRQLSPISFLSTLHVRSHAPENVQK